MREIDVELQFDWQHLSGVKIDYFPHKPELHNVTNNQCDIVRLAMQKVMAAGYRRIGFVMHRGWDDSVTIVDRRVSLRTAESGSAESYPRASFPVRSAGRTLVQGKPVRRDPGSEAV